MNLVDGTEEPVKYNGKKVGELGRDSDMRRARVFKWNQREFRAKNGFGMSKGLHELLVDEDVEHVFIEGQYYHIDSIRNMELVDPDDPLFDNPPDEPQYIVR